jgi:ribosome-associated protein
LSSYSEAKRFDVSNEALNDIIIDSIADIKGKNVVKLDLRKVDDRPTEYFIICEGDSVTQVRALGESVKKRVKDEAGILPSNMEGQQGSKWICIDYFSTVVHVFYPETREFYALEHLWRDADVTEYGHI